MPLTFATMCTSTQNIQGGPKKLAANFCPYRRQNNIDRFSKNFSPAHSVENL